MSLARMTTLRRTLVITPTFAEAEAGMRLRVADQDWLWFSSRRVAARWLFRCTARGIDIDATWVVPPRTAERRSA